MIIMYWTHPEIQEPLGAAAWRALYPEFRVYSDEDVYPLLPSEFVPIYKQIRLPAGKSDIARLFLLREYGGLYIDAHVGPTDPAKLVDTLDKLSAYNIIVFGYGWEMKKETDFYLMNGIIAARRNAPELTLLINRILRNVTTLKAKEDVTT